MWLGPVRLLYSVLFFFFFKIILLLNLQYIILNFAHAHKTESSLFGDNSEQHRMNATLA